MFQHPGSRQAFPSNDYSYCGMTMREYMVAAALTGLAREVFLSGRSPDTIAAVAVQLADAAIRRLTDAGGERP